MIVWIDAQISPALAPWLADRFAIDARHIKDLNLVEASDSGILDAVRLADAVVLTKDRDFVNLVRHRGSPTADYLGHLWEYLRIARRCGSST